MTKKDQKEQAYILGRRIHAAARPALDSCMPEMMKLLNESGVPIPADAVTDEKCARMILAILTAVLLMPPEEDKDHLLCHMAEAVRIFSSEVIRVSMDMKTPSHGDIELLLEHTQEHLEREIVEGLDISEVLSKLLGNNINRHKE